MPGPGQAAAPSRALTIAAPATAPTPAATPAANQLAEDEVILTVRVFFGGRGASQPAQEVEVLGSQPLSALVDRIECLYDRPEIYAPPSWKRSHGLVRSHPTLAKHAQTFRVIILTHVLYICSG